METDLYLYQIRFYEEDSEERPLPIITERGIVGGASYKDAMENLENFYGKDAVYAVDYMIYYNEFGSSCYCIPFEENGNIKYPNYEKGEKELPFFIKMHGRFANED